MLHQVHMLTPNEHYFYGPDQVLFDHQRVKCPRKTTPREKVWLADSLLNLPIAGSLADSELSFGRFSTKNMNNFLMSASLE